MKQKIIKELQDTRKKFNFLIFTKFKVRYWFNNNNNNVNT